MKKMKAIKIFADWKPKKEIKSKRFIKNKRAQEGCRVWHNPRAEIVNISIPKICPTELLVKVKVCGICGSDVSMAWPDKDGYTRYPYIMSKGVTIGHEFSGVVVEIGKGLKKIQQHLKKKDCFEIGMPIAAQCVIPCGYCEMCKEGRFDSCYLNEERGFSVDGAMAEYIKVDARHVYNLRSLDKLFTDRKKSFLTGALIEPLAGVYKALHEVGGGLNPGDGAIVFGGGPIGLSAVAILKAMGAGIVILVEPSSSRRKLGMKMGADWAIDPFIDMQKRILEIMDGSGAKIYFDAAGVAPKIWPDISALLQKGEQGGKLILFGHGPGEMKVSHEVFIGTYASMFGSHGHCGVWRDIIRMIGSGLIDPTKMVTKEIQLEEVPEWLEILRTNKREGKIVITKFD